jgi:hypothetical protein
MKTYGKWTYDLAFLTSAVDGGPALSLDRFTLRERVIGTHWTDGWVTVTELSMSDGKILF